MIKFVYEKLSGPQSVFVAKDYYDVFYDNIYVGRLVFYKGDKEYSYEQNRVGVLTASDLKQISDKLDELNAGGKNA